MATTVLFFQPLLWWLARRIDATVTTPKDAVDSGSIEGQVVGHDGDPVAGARLFWFRTRVHDVSPMMARLVALSGVVGRFSFAPPDLPDPDTEPASWAFHERMFVIAPGHGFASTWPEGIRRDGVVKMPASGPALRGRIVNIDGEPVAAATIRIRHYTELNDRPHNLTEIQTRDKTDAEWRARLSNLLNVIEPDSQRFALPSATTDANGRFELKDIGPDRLLQLLLTGEGIQSTDIIARNTDDETIEVGTDRHSTREKTAVHGNNFLFVAGPSTPVSGRVVDLDSGEPIENAVVREKNAKSSCFTARRAWQVALSSLKTSSNPLKSN